MTDRVHDARLVFCVDNGQQSRAFEFIHSRQPLGDMRRLFLMLQALLA